MPRGEADGLEAVPGGGVLEGLEEEEAEDPRHAVLVAPPAVTAIGAPSALAGRKGQGAAGGKGRVPIGGGPMGSAGRSPGTESAVPSDPRTVNRRFRGQWGKA